MPSRAMGFPRPLVQWRPRRRALLGSTPATSPDASRMVQSIVTPAGFLGAPHPVRWPPHGLAHSPHGPARRRPGGRLPRPDHPGHPARGVRGARGRSLRRVDFGKSSRGCSPAARRRSSERVGPDAELISAATDPQEAQTVEWKRSWSATVASLTDVVMRAPTRRACAATMAPPQGRPWEARWITRGRASPCFLGDPDRWDRKTGQVEEPTGAAHPAVDDVGSRPMDG